MPQAAGSVIENNFSKGLITEASGLNFPENACTETENCVFERTGFVARRLGINYEPTFQTKEADREDGAVVSYLWKNVAGQPDLNILVVQIGNTLHFWDASTTDPLSNHPITYTYDLTDQQSEAQPEPRLAECQFADGNGKLFVVNPYMWPFRIDWDENTSEGEVTRLNLKIRDVEGIDEELDDDERPDGDLSTISDDHEYNLKNQGWTEWALEKWEAERDDMPSNCDVPWRFKIIDAGSGKRIFDFTEDNVLDRVVGNTPAPKGKTILNLFNQVRTLFDSSNVDQLVIREKPSAVAFFSGRVFYAGINNEECNSKIYFTQIVERDEQYAYCYQINDPTSEDLFDLLPTDGGVIKVQEIGNIIKMMSIGPGLLVFATNGVWMIVGSQGLGFAANDYSVTKISNVPAISGSSFVEVSGTASWWNLEGIYSVAQGSGGSSLAPQVQSLTEQTIKTYYNTIPPAAKRRAQGCYNPNTGVVQWLYREAEAGSVAELYDGTHILNLDIISNAFYVWTLPDGDDDAKVHSVFILENISGNPEEEQVFDEDDNEITVDLGDGDEDVFIFDISNFINTPKFKYVSSNPTETGYEFTFSEAWDEDYVDFADFEEQDFTSYFVSGYKVYGELSRRFQAPYVTILSKGPEATSYKFNGRWNYGNTGNSGKWSTQELVELDDSNFDYLRKRHKLRGFGRALQFKISSVPGEPFNIVGWNTTVTANQRI